MPIWRVTLLAAVQILVSETSAGQGETVFAKPGGRYFAHLSQPQFAGMHLADAWLDGQSIVSASDLMGIRQAHDLSVRMRLALANSPSKRSGVRIRIHGAAGQAEQTYWFATDRWRVGELHEWTGSFRVPAMTMAGRGTVSISQLVPPQPGPVPLGDGTRIPVDETLLFRGPVFVEPSSATSRVSDAALKDAFGESIVRLGTAVRLAPSTSIRVKVLLPADARCVGVGIVSAMGGGFDIKQGAPVVAIDAEPLGESMVFHAGEDTSFIDSAAPPPGVVRLDSGDAFLTPPAPFADWHDGPVDASIHMSTRLFERAGRVEALTLAYRHATDFIDVYEIVCLLEGAAPR